MLKRKTRWFLHPQNAHTNAVVAAELTAHCFAEAFSIRVVQRSDLELWEIPFAKLEQLLSSARRSALRFTTYVQEGSGMIRKAPRFFQISGWKRSKKGQKAPF